MIKNEDILNIIKEARKEDISSDLRELLSIIEKNQTIQKNIVDAYNQDLVFEQDMEYIKDFQDFQD